MRRGVGAKDVQFFSNAQVPTGGTGHGRNGGLFSSSSSSAGDSDASDGENTSERRVGAVPPLLGATARSHSATLLSKSHSGADFRRRAMVSISSTMLSSSIGPGESVGHAGERRGLFEQDDDIGDSLETFHERAKLRQSKKLSELKALRVQLETALQRVNDLEIRLVETTKEKEEFAIRTKECQRIIEKRNKQLMKASEKMARRSEQYELQVDGIQNELEAATAQCDRLRADAATMKENGKRELEMREQALQEEMDVQNKQHEKLLRTAEVRYHEQKAENVMLAKKLHEIEQQLTTIVAQKPTPAQVMESDEYRNLLKRCEDAEAIGRGLGFQLEKEVQEKKYLRTQLAAFQKSKSAKPALVTAKSFGCAPDATSLELGDDAGTANKAVAASADVAPVMSFDVTADTRSSPTSPATTAKVTPAVEVSCTSVISSPSQNRSRGLSASSFTDDSTKPSVREGKRRAASAQSITFSDPPDKLAEDKAAAGSGKLIAAPVTFFGKLSSRFKRGSSPQNGQNGPNSSNEEHDGVTEGAIAGEVDIASPLFPRQVWGQNKVLKERPRMYVAKSPSHHEDESSDSIFGSESSISDSSDDDMPPPPPPPPISEHKAPSLVTPALHVDTTLRSISSDTSVDAGSSSSSDDDIEKQECREQADISSQISDPLETQGLTRNLGSVQTPSGVPLPSSSSSSLSDDDSDERDIEHSQPFQVDFKQVGSLSASLSSLSPSSSDGDDHVVEMGKLKAHREVRNGSLTGQDHYSRRSSRSPTSSKSRDKSRSLSGLDNPHSSSKSRMNEYMEARARKRNDKIKLTQEKEHEESRRKEEYEKEWEQMAQEERERKRKQQQARRHGRRRPISTKTVRVSQMRQQMNNKQQQKEQKEPPWPRPPHSSTPPRSHGDDGVDVDGRHSQSKSESKTSESEAEEERSSVSFSPSTDSPPLPPEPTAASTELYLRQQARLRERHELEIKKKIEATEADAVRGDIHRRVEMWAFGKELLHMILTLDQVSLNSALKKCQLMVVQSPDDETVRKAYRNIIRVIHPDKLRGATIPEQLEAKELFTVLNQAFENFKNQTR
uniref:J domain-containing protein n=1 Tax=Peronospora matthiolae TaxID=2874970 RepID=A0AAV1VLL1_9STRA